MLAPADERVVVADFGPRSVAPLGAGKAAKELRNPSTLFRAGDTLYVQDKDVTARYEAFTLTADPVGKTTYVEYPVTFLEGGSQALPTGQRVLFSISSKGTPGPAGPPGATGATGPPGPGVPLRRPRRPGAGAWATGTGGRAASTRG